MRNAFVSVFCLLCSLLSGCASTHLRFNTVQHASTLSDIYEKQVLNNLARFQTNPYATPHFEIPSSGGTDISGTIAMESEALNAIRKTIGLTANRTGKSAWTLDPVTDPDKLERMKCAFQKAVGHSSNDCNCCDTQRRVINPEDDNGNIDVCKDPCSRGECWFACSRKRRDALASGCQFGEYRGLFVWVPKSGRSEFSKLVIDTLRYAKKDPPKPPTKEVTIYLDAAGRPTQSWLASQIVRGEIGISEENVGLTDGAQIPSKSDQLSEIINNLTENFYKQLNADRTNDEMLDPLIAPKFKLGPSREEDEVKRKASEAARKIKLHQSPTNSPESLDIRQFDLRQRFTLPDRN